MDRILRSTSPVVTLNNYASDGSLTNPPGGTLTADVKDSAGVAIAGSPFGVTNPPTPQGVPTFTIPANVLNTLDVYDVTWNFSDGSKRYTRFEVVGSFLFTIADFRAFDPDHNATDYPAASVAAVRTAVEDRLEAIAGVSFILRGRRALLDGNDLEKIVLPDVEIQTIISAKVDGVALTSNELADLAAQRYGVLARRTMGVWSSGSQRFRNVEILYEHGWKQPPAPVQRAGLILTRDLIVRFGVESPRATAVFTSEGGGYRVTLAGRDGPTGIPDVDAALVPFTRAKASLGGFA